MRARSLDQALEQLSKGEAGILAGGTDLLGCLRDSVFSTNKLVSITRVKDLKGIIETKEGGLRIGALTSISEIAAHPLIRERYQALGQAALQVATPQLRNQGTIGGNLCQKPRCWYYRGGFHCQRKGGDTCYAFRGENQFHGIFGSDGICCYVHPSDIAPVLTALEAQVRIVGPRGTKVVPIGRFYLLPRENVERETVLETADIVTDIVIPPPAEGLVTRYRKVRVRRSWDFALAGAALALVFKGGKVERAGIVLSGAAPVPWRSRSAEEALTGHVLDHKTIERACRAAVEKAQPLRHNEYKVPLFKAILEEELTGQGRDS